MSTASASQVYPSFPEFRGALPSPLSRFAASFTAGEIRVSGDFEMATSNETGLDRRSFMIASVSTAGASVALLAGSASAQTTSAGLSTAGGWKVAIQTDTFGEVVAEYTASVNGEVGARWTDATAEPGTPIVFILFDSAAPVGGDVLVE